MRELALILACVGATSCSSKVAQSVSNEWVTEKEDAESLFKELAAPGTSDERRDELVTELSGRTLAEVGRLAVQTMQSGKETHVYGIPPKTNKPWVGKEFSEEQRIRSAAWAIWRGALKHTEGPDKCKQLAEWSLGPGSEKEKLFYLISFWFGFYDDQINPTLEAIARDQAQPPEVAVRAATVLMKRAEPNAHLELLIEACDRIKDPHRRSNLFLDGTVVFRTETEGVSRHLSDANEKLLVRYGFAQLDQIDDGKSGSGYFLATHLGEVIGIKPIRDVQNPFQPDQRLAQYQGKHGLDDSFFQDTVNNARAWWREHQKDYVE